MKCHYSLKAVRRETDWPDKTVNNDGLEASVILRVPDIQTLRVLFEMNEIRIVKT